MAQNDSNKNKLNEAWVAQNAADKLGTAEYMLDAKQKWLKLSKDPKFSQGERYEFLLKAGALDQQLWELQQY